MTKKSKSLLPKRIGKVKVGKSIRKGALGDLLASKAGQALIAEAIMAAGTLAAAGIAKASKDKKARKADAATATALSKPARAAHDAGDAAATLTYALGEAVRSFSNALHHAPADRKPTAAWSPLPAAPVKKTRARTRPSAPETPPG